MIPKDAILMFDGNEASIPSGWSRDTRFDGRYIKVTTSDWGATGGSSTHSHTSPSHTHSYSNDGHYHATGTISGNVPDADPAHHGNHKDNPEYDVTTQSHYHNGVNSGAMTNASITSATASVGSASNEVSRYHYIFIKNDSEYSLIPKDAVILRNDVNNRENCTHFDDANGRYAKGSSTTSAGNATDVGSHTHTVTHSHTLTHTHNSASVGTTPSGDLGSENDHLCCRDHGHTVYFDSYSHTVNHSTSTSSYNLSTSLKYQELHHWKADKQITVKEGDIIIWTKSTLPLGWDDLGLDNVYIRGKAQGQALSSGGSLTHSHSGITHSHSGVSHRHSWHTNTQSMNGYYMGGGSTAMAGNHSHTGYTDYKTSPGTGSTTLTINSSSHEPPYIKVRLLIATKVAVGVGQGGAFIATSS